MIYHNAKTDNHTSIILDSKGENMCCYTATSFWEKLEKYDELFKNIQIR